MKWINLADRRPPEDNNYAMRVLSRDTYFGSDDIIRYRQSTAYNEGELVEIGSSGDGYTFPTKVVEWLDEEESKGMVLCWVPEGSLVVPQGMQKSWAKRILKL